MDWKRKLFPLTAVLLCTSVVIATSAIADDEAPAIRGKSTLKASTGWATNPDGAAQGSSGATVGTTTPGRTPLAIHQGTPLPPTEKLDKWDPSRTHSVSDLDTNQQRGGLRATGDDCSDPYVITSLPYTDQNDTTGRGVDYGTYEDCSGPTIYSDVVYSYTPTADIALRISTCSTDVEAGSHNQDTRLLIFEDSCTGDVASCNDDSLDSCIVEWPEQPQDASRMATVDGFIAELGHTYYIVVTEWGDEGDENCGDGTYELNVRLADPGGCCHIVPPPDSCSNGVYSPDCLGLADVFTANTACPSPCQEDPDPTDHDCPEDVIWGPGTSGTQWYVGNAISDAGAVDRKQYEAFWNLEDPIAALRVWGVTANFDWDTACNKFENVDFFVEFWSESGDFGPGTLVHGPWRIARGPDLTVLDYGVGF
ncbi:MAG: hypothetical protein GY842_19635, partial [bacterium]|nr:hypothetical protein [bacterium]